MAKTMRKKNFKIQILAGNTLMSRFHVGFEIDLPLVHTKEHYIEKKIYTRIIGQIQINHFVLPSYKIISSSEHRNVKVFVADKYKVIKDDFVIWHNAAR